MFPEFPMWNTVILVLVLGVLAACGKTKEDEADVGTDVVASDSASTDAVEASTDATATLAADGTPVAG